MSVLSEGKNVLYNIVGFARDSVRAHVTTLRPENFPSDKKEPWLVDFFAPVGDRRLEIRKMTDTCRKLVFLSFIYVSALF